MLKVLSSSGCKEQRRDGVRHLQERIGWEARAHRRPGASTRTSADQVPRVDDLRQDADNGLKEQDEEPYRGERTDVRHHVRGRQGPRSERPFREDQALEGDIRGVRGRRPRAHRTRPLVIIRRVAQFRDFGIKL